MINDLLGTAQQMLTNVTGFILELGCLFMMFVIIFGCIFFFTGYAQRTGKNLLVNGIIGMITVSMLYMWILNTNGPPDITIFFLDLS